MDDDMDIPMDDELEWLEANSHLHDDYYSDIEPPEPFPEEDEEPKAPPQHNEDEEEHGHHNHQQPISTISKPAIVIPPKPTPNLEQPINSKTQLNGKKRFRSDARDSLNPEDAPPEEDKRLRIDEPESVIEEDWLRYSPSHKEAPTTVEPEAVEGEKIVSRYASEIDGDFISVTGPDGERVYAKMSGFEEVRLKKLDVKAYPDGLISEPINVLMQKVEHDAFMKALETSGDGQNDVIVPEMPVVTEQLWVDKYSPSSFMDLLSDEQTNREVLLWLKQWDSCVFGSEIRSTTDEVLSALRRHSSVVQRQKFSEKNSWMRKESRFSKEMSSNYGHQDRANSFGMRKESRFSKETPSNYSDQDQANNESVGSQQLWSNKLKNSGPPEQKILLLCGPPGLGKTTLAHVAATHCGYRVVEINASDDRSTSTLEAKILDVVQMNSVMADSKPKCLIIDEIDGALADGKGAVEVLLKMVSAERKLAHGKENADREEQSGRTSKKKHKKTSLSRPVICICNDLYAPALRPLRQVAKVHIFVQPTVSRVVNRLKYICKNEGLKTSSIALTALAECTECDIRSCLHTIQFLNKKGETLNVWDISSQVVGRKDASKSAFDVWKEIFQKRKVKRERKSNNGRSNASNEFDFLYSLISNRGEYDIVLDGIHENILQLNYHDPLMQKTVKCLHGLEISDIIHQYIMRTQQMSLLAYQPAFAIAARRLIAQVEKPHIEWPKSFHRCRIMLMEKVDTIRSWHNKITPYISRHLSIKSFVEDSVSPLLHILSPPTLRPVAMQLLSEREKNDLVQLVNTMVSYSITYKNMRSDPLSNTPKQEAALDAMVLSFDPSIGDFVNFKNYSSGHFVLALAVKQVLVHEVEKQKIMQGSIDRSIHPKDAFNQSRTMSSTSNGAPSSALTIENVRNPSKLGEPQLLNHPNSLSSGSIESATAISKMRSPKDRKKPSSSTNFFSRFRKLNDSGSQTSGSVVERPVTLERDLRPLLFKFNEGFTNAVKRPVRIREFLL